MLMGFVPPFCPQTECARHAAPEPRFFVRHGFFTARCHDEPVPRFRCRSCKRTFSTQTFRQDYRDRRPEVNAELSERLVSGTGYRQLGRTLKLGVSAVQRKARKLARHAKFLHVNLSSRLPPGRTYVLDEEETYEHASIRPLTMPVLIEKEHWFVVATAVGPIRRLAPATTARRRRQERDERKHGRRPDASAERVRSVLQGLADRLDASSFVLRSDMKASYATIAADIFGAKVTHERTSGRAARTPQNPLFAINTTLAMTRDNCGRLRRKSWLVTKKGDYLLLHMQQFMVYRNYIRRRFNYDKEDKSSAVHLNLIPRSLTFADATRWRQDWGQNSIHPLCVTGSRRIRDGNAALT
jgi:transposase-like protein